jgi:hypothetical protein
MRFTSKTTIFGMKASKGQLDNGTAYDSTKVYALADLDKSRGESFGLCGTEYTFGTSKEIDPYRAATFPFDAEVDFDLVSNGKAQKLVIAAIRPVKSKA